MLFRSRIQQFNTKEPQNDRSLTLDMRSWSSCPFRANCRGSISSLSAASSSLPSGARDLSSSARVSIPICFAASANCFLRILISSWKILSELSPILNKLHVVRYMSTGPWDILTVKADVSHSTTGTYQRLSCPSRQACSPSLQKQHQ